MGKTADPKCHIDFSSFVGFVCDQDDEALDPHWVIQFDHNCMAVIAYDFVGRFETYATDIASVLDHLGIGTNFLAVADSHRTEAAARLDEFITRDVRTRIEQRYCRDYDAFGC